MGPAHLHPPIDHPSAPVPRTLITLCTFNEIENIREVIAQVRRALPHADILVVDDLSPDGTGSAVAELQRGDSQLHLLSRSGRKGLGAATVAALCWGQNASRYTWLVNLDADLSHPPADIPRIVQTLESGFADVVIGSRYVSGGKILGWPLRRHIMSRAINWFSRVLLGIPAQDCSGAFRGFRLAKLDGLDWNQFIAWGYAFEEELLFRLHRHGCRISEIPITFEERVAGASKVNIRKIVVALGDLTRLATLRFSGGRLGGTSSKSS